MTGFDVASTLSPDCVAVLPDVSDWYNQRTQTIFLSTATQFGKSVKAKALAAHEAAHSLQQHERSWLFLIWKSWPVQSQLLPFLYLFITLAMVPFNILLATLLFLSMFILAEARRMVIVSLERDASKRAMKLLLTHGFILERERKDAETLLAECADTYRTV